MLKNLINLFFPEVCLGCKAFLVANEMVICTNCRHEIPLTQHHLNPENDAVKLFYGRIPLEFASSMLGFHKKGMVQELIHNLKYYGHQNIGTVLGNWYAEDLKSVASVKNIDIIVTVPLHKKRLKERGFNQVTTFVKALSEHLKIELDEELLVRKVYSKTQSQKGFVERTNVNESIFDVNYNESHYNKHYLLVDDVLTTGATLENCGKAILKIPGSKLSIVTIAISHL